MSTAYTGVKPKLSIVEIINMSVGFFGIQFGWDLQRANMGRIYENLGAKPEEVPLLFLAAPLTGLIVQPIIGYMSDHTWHPRWGRRRPYFMIGAIIASIALIFMPHSGELWMAAGLLWVLDVFGNVAMEPFRAFVTDKLPDSQVNRGFIMQSFMIGVGGTIASALPWLMTNLMGMENTSAEGIPPNVKWSFYIGAFFFFFAVMYTVFTTREYPPSDLGYKQKVKESRKGFGAGAGEIFRALKNMPPRMRIISLVQFFTWPGLFLMWFYYTTAVGVNVFGGKAESNDPVFAEGADFGSLTLSFYSVVTLFFALALPFIADRLGRKWTHGLCLLCGALGLISVGWVTEKNMLFLCMAGIGIAWASILSMPYAMLSGSLPKDKVGIYMGIFNFFIVLPEIIASLGFGWLMKNVLNNDRVLAVQVGGGLMALAALICFLFIRDKSPKEPLATKLEIEERRTV